jgi:hypothetical protein
VTEFRSEEAFAKGPKDIIIDIPDGRSGVIYVLFAERGNDPAHLSQAMIQAVALRGMFSNGQGPLGRMLIKDWSDRKRSSKNSERSFGWQI